MNGKIIFRRRSHLTEDEVIAGFLENDSKVVEVVKKEVVKIANYQVRKMLPKANRDLVNEFAQDALSKLSEVIITKTPSYHKNYLGFCTLCIRNTIFNIKRDPKTIDTEFLEQIAREPRVDDDGDIKHFEMLYSTRLAAMYYCVAALEEPCNNLINLTFLNTDSEKVSARNLSEILDISENNARAKKKRCLDLVRRCMKQKGFYN